MFVISIVKPKTTQQPRKNLYLTFSLTAVTKALFKVGMRKYEWRYNMKILADAVPNLLKCLVLSVFS